MGTKEEWKDTGKAFGGAFTKLLKTSIKSVATGVHKAEEWANEDDTKEKGAENPGAEKNSESNVFNDGSWRETGKGIGEAFKGLGKTVARTAEDGVQKAGNWSKSREEEAAYGGTVTVEATEIENNPESK